MILENNKITVNTYIDNVGIRIECRDEIAQYRIYNMIINYLRQNKIVHVLQDKKYSRCDYKIDSLREGNKTLGKIGRGYYKIDYPDYKQEVWYLNIDFFGLKRYDDKVDEKSLNTLWNIVAFLNYNHIGYVLTQIDIALDVNEPLDNLLAYCNRKAPHTTYYPLGDDINGKKIQEYDGTYNIERHKNSRIKRNRVKSGTLYNKRKKELDKTKKDIGFDLSRFEVTFGKQFFIKNKFCISSFIKILGTYSFVSFDTVTNKQSFIHEFNLAKDSRQRNRVREKFTNHMICYVANISTISDFLRTLDTITFDVFGNFVSTPKECYLYGMSKFNRYKKF